MNAAFARSSLALVVGLTLGPLNTRAGDWPQWRGPNRNGHAPANSLLPPVLPKELKPLWKISVGGGFSAPVVAGEKVVYLDEHDGKEIAHALDAASGKELWKVEYAESFSDEWGVGP